MNEPDIKTILCPIDFSKAAAPTARAAAAMARMANARLVLFYAAPAYEKHHVFQIDTEELTRFAQSILEGAERKMAEFIAEVFPDDHGLQLETSVKGGQAASTILEAIHHEHADLVVMGAHGHSGVALAIFGSVANEVLRSATVPVMTVPYEDTD